MKRVYKYFTYDTGCTLMHVTTESEHDRDVYEANLKTMVRYLRTETEWDISNIQMNLNYEPENPNVLKMTYSAKSTHAFERG